MKFRLILYLALGFIKLGSTTEFFEDQIKCENDFCLKDEKPHSDKIIKPTRVILTGCAGFGGSHALRHYLINTDWEIICPVTFKHKGIPSRIIVAIGNNSEYWDRVEIIKCDLSSPFDDVTINQIGNKIDYIINYASASSVEQSIVTPVPFVINNVELILNLLELSRKIQPKAFLQISTDEIYGPTKDDVNYPEWSPIVPSNPYSASKAAQEAIAISYWRTYRVPLVIVNCMNLFGETQDPEKFVPKIISSVIKGKTVPVYHSPTDEKIGSRFYLHARNLADSILFLIKRNTVSLHSDEILKPDRWNIVGSHEISNLELPQMIAKMLNKPLKYEFVDYHKSRPGHDLRYGLDGKKIAKAGWIPPINLEESLRKLVNWTVNRPIWANREKQEM